MNDALILAAARLKKELEAQKKTLSVCESITCGLISAAMGEIPGVSAVFAGGAITYMTFVKTILAGVSEEHLNKHGAIDPETARQMCEGIRKKIGTDCAVSVTGNAGPDPIEDKPTGLVYIGVTDGHRTVVHEYHFTGDRASIRRQTAEQAMNDMLELLKRK